MGVGRCFWPRNVDNYWVPGGVAPRYICWDSEREKGEHPLGDVSGELLYSGVRVALQPANNKGRTLFCEKDPKGTCLYIFGLMNAYDSYANSWILDRYEPCQAASSKTCPNFYAKRFSEEYQSITQKVFAQNPERFPQDASCLYIHFCTCPNHPPMLDPKHPKTVHLWNTGRAVAAYKQQHHVTIIFWVPVGPWVTALSAFQVFTLPRFLWAYAVLLSRSFRLRLDGKDNKDHGAVHFLSGENHVWLGETSHWCVRCRPRKIETWHPKPNAWKIVGRGSSQHFSPEPVWTRFEQRPGLAFLPQKIETTY